jgi:chromosomal replication initiation ATPase DnaA
VVSKGAHLIGAATVPPRALAPLRAAIERRWPVRQCIVNPPTMRETREILRALAARESVSISASTIARVARRARGDVRRAVGALNQLQAESTLSAGRVGLPWMAEYGAQAGW